MKKLIAVLTCIVIIAAACSNQNGKKSIRIGFSMATLKEERWQRDKRAFDEYCREIGADCRITVADNDAGRQASDVENLLTQGIDVLIIAPHDAVQAATLVDKAKAEGIPVISYDRLIHSDKIDLYISHQVPVIGYKMAEYALQKVPKGNYVMVYGGFTDNNAHIIKKEQMKVLQPAIERKDVKIVAEQFINDWKKEEAQKFAENALTQNNDNVDVFLVSNDGMAGGVIQALERRGLAGKILVTGQDAELAALQLIAEGKQTMTIYKPIVPLARGAIDAALKLAKKEPLTEAKPFYNDVIKKEIPAILLDVFVVDKDNLVDTVIKDGYADYEKVFANVPPEKRPPKKF